MADTIFLLIAGGRDFSDYSLALKTLDDYETLDAGGRSIVVVSGGARGADAIGEMWAKARGHTISRMTPDWNLYGRRAGLVRNTDLVNACSDAVVFWDGSSRGTKDTITKLQAAGKTHRIITYGNVVQIQTTMA